MEEEEEIPWECCFSSDLPRAVYTAEQRASCPIVKLPLLREVPLVPFIKTSLKVPYPIWNMAGRLAWLGSCSSQPETRKQTIERAKKAVAFIEKEGKSSLVVTHGFFLYVLAKELEKKGYTGPRKRRFRNGELSVYEKGGTSENRESRQAMS